MDTRLIVVIIGLLVMLFASTFHEHDDISERIEVADHVNVRRHH